MQCKITGGDLSTTDETVAFYFASHDEISDLASEAYAVRVTDALADTQLSGVSFAELADCATGYPAARRNPIAMTTMASGSGARPTSR